LQGGSTEFSWAVSGETVGGNVNAAVFLSHRRQRDQAQTAITLSPSSAITANLIIVITSLAKPFAFEQWTNHHFDAVKTLSLSDYLWD
jgi:hypothetical protein